MCPPTPATSSPLYAPSGEAPASDGPRLWPCPSEIRDLLGTGDRAWVTVRGSGKVQSKPAFQPHLGGCPVPLQGLCSPSRALALPTPRLRPSQEGRAEDGEVVVNNESFEGNLGTLWGSHGEREVSSDKPASTLDFGWQLPKLSEPQSPHQGPRWVLSELLH